MARKLIDQNEAARILGITPEQVASLRDRKKLFPYRDGDEWKYKQEDIEQYREKMKHEKPEPAADEEAPVWDSGSDSMLAKSLDSAEAAEDSADVTSGDALDVDEEIDSILLSEVELGKSAMEGASTIIGKPDEGPAEDADLPPAPVSKENEPIPFDDDADFGISPAMQASPTM